MELKKIIIPVTLLVLLFLAACNQLSSTQLPSPSVAAVASTPDIPVTAEAAIQATALIQTAVQATVNAAIDITATSQAIANPELAQSLSTSVPAAQPTATLQVNYYAISEEELAALIDQSVNEALAASIEATNATTSATSDGTVSSEETVNVIVSVEGAEQAIAEAEQLIEAYAMLYGDYATETIALLTEIEQELSAINQSMATIAQVLSQGSEAATAAIDQINSAVQENYLNLPEAQTRVQDYMPTFQNELNQLEQTALNIAPDEIPTNRLAALESAREYGEALTKSMADNKITKAEFEKIATLGANAAAGLKNNGGPQLSGLSDVITNLTRQFSRGQLPQARGGLNNLMNSLPRR